MSVTEYVGLACCTALALLAWKELTVSVVVPPTFSSTGPPVPVWSPASSSFNVTINSNTVELLSLAVILKSFSPYTPDPTSFENIVWCEPVMSTLPIEVVVPEPVVVVAVLPNLIVPAPENRFDQEVPFDPEPPPRR